MIKQSELYELVQQQWALLAEKDAGYERNLLSHLPANLPNHALIVSGIRRCGKSTLLQQLLLRQTNNAFFINFDTPKLYNFELTDFKLLDEIIARTGKQILFFDEIQVVKGWERYIRPKLDENFKVFMTGSNASLLSRELGTKLTGRHVTRELFPFSFNEFCNFQRFEPDETSVSEYLRIGGFPEY